MFPPNGSSSQNVKVQELRKRPTIITPVPMRETKQKLFGGPVASPWRDPRPGLGLLRRPAAVSLLLGFVFQAGTKCEARAPLFDYFKIDLNLGVLVLGMNTPRV